MGSRLAVAAGRQAGKVERVQAQRCSRGASLHVQVEHTCGRGCAALQLSRHGGRRVDMVHGHRHRHRSAPAIRGQQACEARVGGRSLVSRPAVQLSAAAAAVDGGIWAASSSLLLGTACLPGCGIAGGGGLALRPLAPRLPLELRRDRPRRGAGPGMVDGGKVPSAAPTGAAPSHGSAAGAPSAGSARPPSMICTAQSAGVPPLRQPMPGGWRGSGWRGSRRR